MKCPKCKSKKEMGSTHVIDKDKQVVPSWLCTFCGCNQIKTREELYQKVIDTASKIEYPTYNGYVIVDKERFKILFGDLWKTS